MAGRVHEVQKDGEALGVHLGVQADGVQVTLVGVREDGVEQPAEGRGGEEQRGLCSAPWSGFI